MRNATMIAISSCLLASTAANAGTVSEDLGDGRYFVEYQRGKLTRGGLLDTAKRADRKLVRGYHRVCLTEGYDYVYEYSPVEIATDEEMRAIWTVMVGDAGARDSKQSGNAWEGSLTSHESRAIVKFVEELPDEDETVDGLEAEDFTLCDPEEVKVVKGDKLKTKRE